MFFLSTGDCHSNDPANAKGPKLRSWQDPIGSIRPMRGLNCTSLRVSVVLDWNSLAVKHQMEVVESHQVLAHTVLLQNVASRNVNVN
jgi:hypothetical protein